MTNEMCLQSSVVKATVSGLHSTQVKSSSLLMQYDIRTLLHEREKKLKKKKTLTT